MQYHFNSDMIEYYKVSSSGKLILDHKGNKIFVPKEYRDKSNMWQEWSK